MTKRASVFESDDLDLDVSGFTPQAPAADAMPAEQVRAVAEASKFPSREAKQAKAPAPAAPKPTPSRPGARRQYRTGRSLAINVRAHEGTYTDFYAIVDGKMDGKSRPAADVMEMAVAALKRELAGQS